MEEKNSESTFDTGSTGEDAELYLLKWNSHQNHFASKFSELLDEDEISFADVTLACEGHFLQAHRLVLSVCSPFFKNLFKVNCAEKGTATIVLANVRYTDLENILHFIYRGQVNVRKEDINKFLETGEQLQIDGLVGQGQGQSQTKQTTPSKRRYSDGGQMLNRQATSAYLNKNDTSKSSSPSQLKGDRTRNLSRHPCLLPQTNHIQDNIKKPRISPSTSGISRNSQESAPKAPSRRPSTSTHQNNSGSPNTPNSHIDTSSGLELDGDGGTESSTIKIVSVGSANPRASDFIEILDYEDEDEERQENEMDESMNLYGDGGDEGVFYAFPSSSYPRQQGSSQQTRQSDPAFRNTLHARYPSIIDGVHFDLISADEKRVAAQCKLCPGEKIIRGSGLTSSNFISHLRAFHKRELEEWREKRKNENRRRQD